MQQWDFVSAIENSNDGGSRGLDAARVDSRGCWFQGSLLLSRRFKDLRRFIYYYLRRLLLSKLMEGYLQMITN